MSPPHTLPDSLGRPPEGQTQTTVAAAEEEEGARYRVPDAYRDNLEPLNAVLRAPAASDTGRRADSRFDEIDSNETGIIRPLAEESLQTGAAAAVGAAAAPHVSELQLLTELWAATAMRLEAMQEAQPAALAALEPRLAAFREQLGSAEPGAVDGLWAAYREITSEIARLEAASAAEGEGALGEAAEAGERAEEAVPSVDK